MDQTSPAPRGPASVVVIGKFDGVHAGHRAVLALGRRRADELGVPLVALTFDKNPLALLNPERCPPDLLSTERKSELLIEAGADSVSVLSFTRELADMEPEDFARVVLAETLGAREVLVGDDFRYGAGGRGDATTLAASGVELGFGVTQIGGVTTESGSRVSSSAIRAAIADGDIDRATDMLGRPPRVSGTVVHGDARGRTLGVPTANLSPDAVGVLPADGVYAGWLTVDGIAHPAAISVGSNPTFDGHIARRLEAHALDIDDPDAFDIYGAHAEVDLVAHLRPMVRFDTLDELVEQMASDLAAARSVLTSTEADPR